MTRSRGWDVRIRTTVVREDLEVEVEADAKLTPPERENGWPGGIEDIQIRLPGGAAMAVTDAEYDRISQELAESYEG